MTHVWLFASLILHIPPRPPDDARWKLPELKNPFPERDRPKPLPPEDQLKLRDLKLIDD
jgi:hypothetical protein